MNVDEIVLMWNFGVTFDSKVILTLNCLSIRQNPYSNIIFSKLSRQGKSKVKNRYKSHNNL